MSSLRTLGARGSVVAVGAFTLALAATYIAVAPALVSSPTPAPGSSWLRLSLLQTAVPQVVGATVAVAGLRFARTREPSFVLRVGLWAAGAGLATLLVAGWVLALQATVGELGAVPWFIPLNALAVGIAGGTVIGVALQRARRHGEQAIEQQHRLAEFAGIVAHDLRNPLTIARGRLDLARSTGDPEHFEAVEQSLVRMERLSQEVLALAREDVAADTLEWVDVDEVVERAAETIGQDLRLTVRTERSVRADPRRFQTLLENLLQNAADHAGGDAAVSVTVGDVADGIYIEDDGPGIPPAARERVFEGGYSTTDGSGFGLAIVRQIADAHGWAHEFVEPTGEGARFELREME